MQNSKRLELFKQHLQWYEWNDELKADLFLNFVLSEICGDNDVVGNETCDDRNTVPGDGCDGNCRLENGWNCDTGICERMIRAQHKAQEFPTLLTSTLSTHILSYMW